MSLYLKYRPQDFENLEWQEFVKQNLKKAITENRTVGAYLLCGPRGTWKTTTARLLAKSINCLDLKEWNPCMKCDVCIGMNNESLIDIVEIDAASHTGVDNMRDLIEKSHFQPTFTKYKVYIIDEVHMLSTGAFNALLKILEEPPKHVKFILATTETHKVPATIISRCQRYDFKRISAEDIKKRLLFIAQSEWVEIDEDSLIYIIENSAGGLRNAISLFEQLISDKKIDFSDVQKKLWLWENENISLMIEYLLTHDSQAIRLFHEVSNKGTNIKHFFKDVLYKTKDLAITSVMKKENIWEHVKILQILETTFVQVKQSLDEELSFMIAVLQIIGKIETSAPQTNNQVSQKTTNIPKKSEAPINKPVVNNTPVVEVQKSTPNESETISANDVGDLFDTPPVSQPKDTSFSIEWFIKALKKAGAKGWLTMALRGASISLRWNELKIVTKTKIAQWQTTNADNVAVMLGVLKELWVDNPIIT